MSPALQPPGRLPAAARPEVVAMLCTAGHVDHGKTSLVKLLTGCETDRLKEEIERGMTIELGFAPCFLGGNLCVGVVDVPGHERFIKNMVAGVSGIDLALLVIAADDGVMPQTVEHVQIMELLGVNAALVALTKTDLVGPADVARRADEIRAFLAPTALREAPVYPVSSVTGEGYAELYDALVARVAGLARRRRDGVFRMPVERFFRREGFGLVLSGIPVAGAIEVGAQVELAPHGAVGRVRGMQCFLRDARSGGAGQCLALNVPDFAKVDAVRGDVLGLPGFLRAARVFHARLRAVPGLERPLRSGEPVKFHTGTREESGRLFLLEGRELAAGATGWGTVRTDRPVVAAEGDLFVVRRLSPPWTAAGGWIEDVSPGEDRPRRKPQLDRLAAKEAALGGRRPDDAEEAGAARLRFHLRRDAPLRSTAADAARALLLPVERVRVLVAGLEAAGEAVRLDAEHVVHAERLAECEAEVRARIGAAGAALSVATRDLWAGLDWPPALVAHVRQRLEREGVLRVQGAQVVLAGAAAALPPADRDRAERLFELLEGAGWVTPRPDELPGLLGGTPAEWARAVEHLAHERRIVRLSDAVLLSYPHFQAGQDFAVETARRFGTVNAQQVRERFATTRKYAVAFLEFLDRRRVTQRLGNERKLLPACEKGLL